jgi:hypothetical protein
MFWTVVMGWDTGRVFVADDLVAWLVSLLANSGGKKLTALVLGSEQERALRSAATAAVRLTAEELCQCDDEQAGHVAMVIGHVFSEPVPDPSPAKHETVLEALQTGIAGQLGILDGASLTGTGRSSADVLGVRAAVLAEKLTGHLLREIVNRGSRGGPLSPLANQLNHDVTHLQGRRIHDAVRQLDGKLERLPKRLGSDESAAFPVPIPPIPVESLPGGLPSFTGRSWLFDEVDRFLDQEHRGYLIVMANAGMGKSAFTAQLARRRGYPYHFFSRSQAATDRNAAMLRLGVQLIRQYRLSDPVPASGLSLTADMPAWFAAVLDAAASRRGQAPVVLIVDALDEVDRREDEPALPLPAELPDGVHVIATCRSGTALHQLRRPYRIIDFDNWVTENQADITAYLERAVAGGELHSVLVEKGMPASRFAADLASRCGGLWIYLRLVLDEIVLGLRSPSDLDSLPDDLGGYYATTLASWRCQSGWDESFLPVIAVLAAIKEPVDAELLLRLAGVGGDVNAGAAGAATRFINGPLRPFLSFYQDEGRTGYALRHQSLRDLLTGMQPGRTRLDGGLNDELARATRTAHSRVAGYFLRQWGGLDAGLPVLAERFEFADVERGYGLRHVAAHLDQAARARDLHQLLRCQHRPAVPGVGGVGDGARTGNLWHTAHDRYGDMRGYLADVQRADDAARAETDRAVTGTKNAPGVGLEIRYALVRASIMTIATRLPPPVIERAVETRTWTAHQALTYIKRIAEPGQRVRALAAVAPHLPDRQVRDEVDQAISMALAMSSGLDRVEALTVMAPHCPAARWPELLAGIAEADMRRIPDPRIGALERLASLCPPAVFSCLIDVACALPGGETALSGIAPHCPPGLAGRLTEIACSIKDESHRADALANIAGCCPASLADRLIDAALDIRCSGYPALAAKDRAPVLAAVARRFSPGITQRLAEAALSTETPYERATGLADAARYSSSDQRAHLTASALSQARAISDPYRRADVLARIAPACPAELVDRLIGMAEDLDTGHGRHRVEILTALMPHCPPGRLQEVTTRILSAVDTADGWHGGPALRAIARCCPPEFTEQVADAVRGRGQPYLQAEVLGILAARAAGSHQCRMLISEVIDAARGIQDDPFGMRQRALAIIAPYCPAELIDELVTVARGGGESVYWIRTLAKSAEHMPDELAGQLLAAAEEIASFNIRGCMLQALVKHCPASLISRLLYAVPPSSSRYTWATKVLEDVAPKCPPALVPQLIDTGRAISDAGKRASALASLSPYCSTPRKPALLAEAVAAARLVDSDSAEILCLADVARNCPPHLIDQLADIARSPEDPFWRGRGLAALAPHVPPERKKEILGEAIKVASALNHQSQAVVLADVAHAGPPCPVEQLLEAASALPFRTIDGQHNDRNLIAILTAVTAWCPPKRTREFTRQLVESAREISDAPDRAESLAAIAACCPSDQRRDLLEEAMQAIPASGLSGHVLAAICEHHSSPQLDVLVAAAIKAALRLSEGPGRTWRLENLAPYCPPGLWPQLVAAAQAITQPCDRVKVLAAAARRSPEHKEALFAEAIESLRATASEEGRALALETIIPECPRRLLGELIDIAGTPPEWINLHVAVARRLAEPSDSPPPDIDESLRLIRSCLRYTDRGSLLTACSAAARNVLETGGASAVDEFADAVLDVGAWWG